jgi:lysozyme
MNREAVYDQLKIDEGIVCEIYLDHLGYKTFGVGHLVRESDPEWNYDVGEPVSVERVVECFESDLDVAVSECVALYGADVWEGFPGEVQEILVNMMFNLGRPRLSKFRKMNAHLVDGEWSAAAIEGRDSRWHKQVGNRAERLMTRLENV